MARPLLLALALSVALVVGGPMPAFARGRGARTSGSATDPAPAHRRRPHRCGPAAPGRPQPPRSVGVLPAGPGIDGERVVSGAANPRSAGLPVAAAERVGTIRTGQWGAAGQ